MPRTKSNPQFTSDGDDLKELLAEEVIEDLQSRRAELERERGRVKRTSHS